MIRTATDSQLDKLNNLINAGQIHSLETNRKETTEYFPDPVVDFTIVVVVGHA